MFVFMLLNEGTAKECNEQKRLLLYYAILHILSNYLTQKCVSTYLEITFKTLNSFKKVLTLKAERCRWDAP